MDFFSSTYNALRGPQGAPQSATDAIGKLSDRLSQSTLLSDRRASVLSLKGLVRDWKTEVGDVALPGLIEVLLNDCEVDADIGKACLETITALCEIGGEGDLHGGVGVPASVVTRANARDSGWRHMDYFLANETATHKLLFLLSDEAFYTRFCSLQLLALLLQHRRTVVQKYFISSPNGIGTSGILAILNDKKEILRNEGLVTLQALTNQNVEIQKILAFGGAFDSLLNIITAEGGVEGGVVVQDALQCLDMLLRLNVSNQTYFRETHLPSLPPLLIFPSTLTLTSDYATPQEFALQFWNEQKSINVGLIVGILGLFSRGAKEGDNIGSAVQRCLIELALASNCPTAVKVKALQGLPTTASAQLATLVITPYAPVPESNGDEWDRLDHTSALSAVVDLALEGEYGGIGQVPDSRPKVALELRAAAAATFENFVRREDIRDAVLRGMSPTDPDTRPPRASVQILSSLTTPPPQPITLTASLKILFSSFLFSSLLRTEPSSSAKSLARRILPFADRPSLSAEGEEKMSRSFFVPADSPTVPPSHGAGAGGDAGDGLGEGAGADRGDDDGDDQTLLQILIEHLSLSFLYRSKSWEGTSMPSPSLGSSEAQDERDWDRLISGYLILLIQWMWDDSASVKEFLDNGGLATLTEPINQPTGVDPIVKGLCTGLLGVCYEYCRLPGQVTSVAEHQYTK
ncbi:hypothetical protein SISSUDRAFT_569242 [Sistotremastrum suecicum HHB10207 ss-3]|uniref:Vesicle tethering protein Uso1/P115-like head domain-containing protein n=1 Tax=Sistotremastrum suecicum HHB10207 ss-3 TaxID=1314776 RepID=A0A165XHM4_9AGAM|nr:hypothetical protein SISSUDRAFT_569242 [Sistotremastrum suecicum HHB10207 ss-3]